MTNVKINDIIRVVKKGVNIMKQRKIYCINDARTYDSIANAATYYNIPHSTISKQLMGIRPQAGGRYFIYIDDGITPEQLKKIRQQKLEEIYKLENM